MYLSVYGKVSQACINHLGGQISQEAMPQRKIFKGIHNMDEEVK